jgi:hypothetical protein
MLYGACRHRIVSVVSPSLSHDMLPVKKHGWPYVAARLKGRRTGRFFALFKRADLLGIFLKAELLVPSLFFLGESGLEDRGLAAVEVQGCGFEACGFLRYEDVFDAGACRSC